MKTTILHLDPHDDIISVRDKMGWSQTGRLLLVWPARGRVLTRQLDLILLQRHSEKMGLQLALVTRDRDVRYHALRLGIPVFKNLRKAQSKSWRVNRWFRREAARTRETLQREAESPRRLPEPPERPKPLSPVVRLLVFSVGVLAMLVIAAALLPTAHLALSPEIREQTAVLELSGRPGLSETQPGIVPIRIHQVTVEGRDRIPVSGTIIVPDRPAEGRVHFTNLTDQPVHVPSGTIVRSPGVAGEEPVRFFTTISGDIPPGPEETISLPVKAERGGRAGNIAAGRLTVIEGPLGLSLTATNPGAATGGTDRTGPAPSEKDRQALFERLESTLQGTAMAELQDNLPPNDLILSAGPELAKILETVYQPEALQPADYLSLSLRLEYEVQVISGADLEQLAEAALDSAAPEGFLPLAGTLRLESKVAGQPDGDGSFPLELLARRTLAADVSELQAVRLALGRSPEQARERLSSIMSLEGPPDITLQPAWWPRLPVLPFRIQVTEIAAAAGSDGAGR